MYGFEPYTPPPEVEKVRMFTVTLAPTERDENGLTSSMSSYALIVEMTTAGGGGGGADGSGGGGEATELEAPALEPALAPPVPPTVISLIS